MQNLQPVHSQQADDVALPYIRPEEEIKQVPFRNLDEVGPAGSINSNVEDMIRYVRFHLNKGKHGDTQLLSAEEEAKEKKAHEAMKQKGYTPPRKAGTSQHPAYSAVTIAVDGTDLKATHNQKTVPLKHWHYDIFEAPEWQGDKVTFFYNNQGDIDRLAVPPERVQRGIQARRRRCRHRHGRLPGQRHLRGRQEIGLLGRGVIGARRWGLARTTTVQRSACEMV